MIQLLTCVIYISLFFVQSRVKIKLMLKCQLCWCHLDDFTKVASATFFNFLMYYFEKKLLFERPYYESISHINKVMKAFHIPL